MTTAVVLALATAIIAVVGTLAGATVSGRIQARTAREGRSAAERTEAITAVAKLAEALANHRKAMWLREDLRAQFGALHSYDEARTRSHETRSAITAPLTAVCIRVPELADAAKRAAEATYALRNAQDGEALTTLRERALRASDRLVSEAARLLGGGSG